MKPNSLADEAAFEQCVAAEMARLYGVALSITGDSVEAEDALQETLLSAWRAWASLRDPAKSAVWLTRICVNHSIHCRRQRLRRLLWVVERPSSDEHLGTLELKSDLLDIHRAFQKLSPRQRAIVVLHLHHGYTLNECAELLDCRPGTARSHFGRAMAKLRTELTGD